MNKRKLTELIKKLVNEYTGTGASGGNAGDGNNITSPRPFADDLEELENYLHKNIYGGEGGHYRKDSDPFNYNRQKMGMFEQAYGSATLTTQGQYKSRFTKTGRPPGIMEKEKLSEFTDYGQEGRYPKKENPGDMFQQKEVEDLFPHGMASRSDKVFQARVKQHADWTEQSGMNNTFVHMQYHETKGLEDEYFIYQTQHYNSNYDDFRNPKFTLLSITKNKDTEKEEDLGEYIVDTDAYIRDLNKFREQGNLGDKVMENLKEQQDPEQKAYEIGLKRLQKGVIQFQLKYIEKQRSKALSQAAKAGQDASKGFDEQIKALKDQIKAIDNPPKQDQKNESLLENYINSRKNSNLMIYMDLYKQATLLEGTMKKLFDKFNKGETNEEVLSYYAKKGISMPETFLSKARKQYENIKKQKLELGFMEQEAKDIVTIPTRVPNLATFDLGDNEKKLAKGIYQEKNNN